jgi:outer membrane immunogenic protein
MNRLLVAAVAAGAMVSVHGNAVAADLPPVRSVPRPPPPPVYNWTACYLGVGGGYGMWNQEAQTQTAAGVPLTATATHGGRGWFATGQFGCDVQLGSTVVLGAFGDYDYSINMKGNVTVPDQDAFGEEKLRWSWAAGARSAGCRCRSF